MWAIGDSMAAGAAMMTGTRLAGEEVLGSAWPRNFNKVVAETMDGNIAQVGLPTWSEADQTLAKALQKELPTWRERRRPAGHRVCRVARPGTGLHGVAA